MYNYIFKDGVKISYIKVNNIVYPLCDIKEINNIPLEKFFHIIDELGGIKNFLSIFNSLQIKK